MSLLAQDSPVRLRIVSPGDQSYASGPVILRAEIDPAAAASQVVRLTLFADGRQVCALEAPPFQCAWDAGERGLNGATVAAGLSKIRRLTRPGCASVKLAACQPPCDKPAT